MNRIDKLFSEKKENILSIYFTAGHPTLNATVEIVKELEQNGVDMIEIGMPFSDPLADGPVIQQSSLAALKNGMSLKMLLGQLAEIRKHVKIPLLLMGYLNPVFQYGMANLLQKMEEIGIDGLILPDLPLSEYEEDYKALFEKHGIYNIFLITPETSGQRLKQIDAISKGFIYMVSSSSTTGAKGSIQSSQEAYFERIRSLELYNPKMLGFGISNRETFAKACQYANGAIIGSAFVNMLEKNQHNTSHGIKEFIESIVVAH
jgi:tryptophan synthase alpha chain